MSNPSNFHSSEKPAQASDKETTTSVSNPIGLADLAASIEALNLETSENPAVVRRTQVSSSARAKETTISPDRRDQRNTSPSPSRKPKRYAIQMWLEVEVGPGLFIPPEDDSFSEDYAVEAVNRAYPGCTGMYRGRDGHMLAFYGRKGSTRAGLTQDVAVEVCRAVGRIPTWMGFGAKWKVRCVSLPEANTILAGCKRLESENRRRERLHYQEQLASMHPYSNLSSTAIPFQPQSTLPVSGLTPATPGCQGLEKGGPMIGSPPSQQVKNPSRDRISSLGNHSPSQPSDEGDLTTDGSSTEDTSHRRKRRSRGSRNGQAGRVNSTTGQSASSVGGKKKKDGFSSKIQIPSFGGKKGHSDDVTGAFRQWARCISYYRDYYEDSYLMPLVVSSLSGDASDVFDWIRSLNPGNTEDLPSLLQMLREHYCGSLTFREQRNSIENLRQKSQEAAIDFLIRVGTSVGNLGKDWKDEITEGELQSLQYEVSLNGVKEEIRHVLDSEIAKQGRLTPQQMYEAVKKYETYVARNKRLDGKSSSSPGGQLKATGHDPGYKHKPRFHKTTAFVAAVAEPEDDDNHPHEPSPPEKAASPGDESSEEEEGGLYIPGYLAEAVPDDPVIQVKLARAMRALEKETRRCYRCDRPGHLQKDCDKVNEKNGKGALPPKGPFQNKSAQEKGKAKPSQQN